MKRIVMLAVVGVSLAGCNKRAAEKAVLANLTDPDSAKFGEFYYNRTTKRACLTVNAKNAMGGYTGNQQVQLLYGEQGWEAIGERDEAPEDCRSGYADVGMPEPAAPVPTGSDALSQMDRDAAKLGAEADAATNDGSAVDNGAGGPTP